MNDTQRKGPFTDEGRVEKHTGRAKEGSVFDPKAAKKNEPNRTQKAVASALDKK